MAPKRDITEITDLNSDSGQLPDNTLDIGRVRRAKRPRKSQYGNIARPMCTSHGFPRSGSADHPPNASSPLSDPPLLSIAEENGEIDRDKDQDDVIGEHIQELDGEDTLSIGDGDRLTDQTRAQTASHEVANTQRLSYYQENRCSNMKDYRRAKGEIEEGKHYETKQKGVLHVEL